MKNFFRKINWPNTLFLILVPLVGVVGTVYLALHHAIAWPTIAVAVFYMIAGGISITAGYHRLYAHRTYRAHPLVRLFFLLFGAATFEGSVIEWSTDHRRHHRYVDTDRDPYNINRGFWYAHIGWLFVLDGDKRDYSNVQDIREDKMAVLQDKYYVRLATFMSGILPALICSLWGDPIGGFVIAGCVRTTLTQHATFLINSICHTWGKRTYTNRQTARDNWVTALLTFGEGYHNFHHQFALDYRNGIRFYHFDPTKWLIYGLSKVGLTGDLKRVSEHKIIAYRLRMDAERLQYVAENSEPLKAHMGNVINPMQACIMQMIGRVEELEKNYGQLQTQSMESFKDKVDDYYHKIQDHRTSIREARSELKRSLSVWTYLVRNGLRMGES